MAKFHIRVAELGVSVAAQGALAERICHPYLSQDKKTDIRIYTTLASIRAKQRSLPIGLSDEQAESICLHEALSLQLLPFDAFVLHAALISYKGMGYAIVAPRGGGKSTHAELWRSAFGEDVSIINGDKPIIRLQKDGTFMGYGTPWCGKEGEGKNAAVPLKGVCLLSKGEKDEVRPVTDRDYVERIIGQVVFPTERATMDKSARLLAHFIRTVPAVAATCTKTEQAAKIVCRALEWKGYHE